MESEEKPIVGSIAILAIEDSELGVGLTKTWNCPTHHFMM